MYRDTWARSAAAVAAPSRTKPMTTTADPTPELAAIFARGILRLRSPQFSVESLG